MTSRELEFYEALEKYPLHNHYVKIILLNFDESTRGEISGEITSGSISVNGSSTIRRTINLSMLVKSTVIDLTSLQNQISIEKKIKVFVGYKNPLPYYSDLCDSDGMVWFKQGTFLVSTASVSKSTSGWTISITAKDKMAFLDGTAGGVLPSSVTFHEEYVEEPNGDLTIERPTIFRIIYEAVTHWGGEAPERVIISDIPETSKMLVRYVGDGTIYFSENWSGFSRLASDNFPHQVVTGQDVGYRITDTTYPGELILAAGETVTSLLDKIKNTLGNFEYFYDVDGVFHFQAIRNYLNTASPLEELVEQDYVQTYNSSGIVVNLTDYDTTTAITETPKYDNIKNDFYVWGMRTDASDMQVGIRYHLALDQKPPIVLAGLAMWEIKVYNDLDMATRVAYLKNKTTRAAAEEREFTKLLSSYDTLYYKFTTANDSVPTLDFPSNSIVTLVGAIIENPDWREELYRRALVSKVSHGQSDQFVAEAEDILESYNQTLRANYYDAELISEWRKLYNPNGNATWGDGVWNPDVRDNPEVLDYWLDFIDSSDAIGKYGIRQIGRRTKVVNEQDIKILKSQEVPDVLFYDDEEDKKYNISAQANDGVYISHIHLTPEKSSLFQISATGASCFDKIRELLYQHLTYNTQMSITCLPKYYLDVNTVIHIEDETNGINGDYQITQFTLPLVYNGTMSITATEVLTRI